MFVYVVIILIKVINFYLNYIKMIFIGIFGGNGGDVVGKLLFLFIIEGDKKVILLILIKCFYYFYFLKRIFWE